MYTGHVTWTEPLAVSALRLLPDHPPVEAGADVPALGVHPGPAGPVTLDTLLSVRHGPPTSATPPLGGRAVHRLKLCRVKTALRVRGDVLITVDWGQTEAPGGASAPVNVSRVIAVSILDGSHFKRHFGSPSRSCFHRRHFRKDIFKCSLIGSEVVGICQHSTQLLLAAQLTLLRLSKART